MSSDKRVGGLKEGRRYNSHFIGVALTARDNGNFALSIPYTVTHNIKSHETLFNQAYDVKSVSLNARTLRAPPQGRAKKN